MKKVMFCLAVLLAACGQRPSVTEELSGRWRVQQIAGASLGEGVDIWVEIDPAAGAISGFTGCNNFTAGVESEAQHLRFTAIATTRMACAESGMATERNLLTALEHTRAYRLEGGELLLLDDTGV